MAYLTVSEREALQRELEQLSFGRANGRLKRMDPMGRMAYYRNAQRTGQWVTRHILAGLGTQVTLVEVNVARATDKPRASATNTPWPRSSWKRLPTTATDPADLHWRPHAL